MSTLLTRRFFIKDGQGRNIIVTFSEEAVTINHQSKNQKLEMSFDDFSKIADKLNSFMGDLVAKNYK